MSVASLMTGSTEAGPEWQRQQQQQQQQGPKPLREVYVLASSKSMAQSHSGKLYKLVDPKRCPRTKCEAGCRNGGVCMEPDQCLCKSGYSGPQCERAERGMPSDQEKDGILDHIIDMTSYLLDLTSYI
ncbi:hypothetical protein CRUP_008887, partial [Coryphaenoides rupestris]